MIDASQVENELGLLKDFQRRTVDYVFRRMYEDDPPAQRFLVADEVGLGKTLVARGVIARAIHHLQATVPRIDIIYLCSNAAIAQQNIQRLNILTEQQTTFATRLTLLPTQLQSLERNRINFVSFTPGTTLDLKSRRGKVDERAILFRMLEGHLGLRTTPLRNFFQATASHEGWDRYLAAADAPISEPLSERFRAWLASSSILEKVGLGCEQFSRRRDNIPAEQRALQREVIGELRHGLATLCIKELEPDLIIVDEFQRFKAILHGQDEAAELAQQLFTYPNARVLLLSATPYRMLTLGEDIDDDHHRDFLETVRFLAQEAEGCDGALPRALSRLRTSLLSNTQSDRDEVRAARKEIETLLSSVMCRTERVAHTRDLDAMIEEHRLDAKVTRDDVDRAVEIDSLSRLIGADDSIEYWKSAPYLLNFMEGYQLKQKLRALDGKHAAAIKALANLRCNLSRSQFEQYLPIAAANPRMRVLLDETLESGSWRLLWLPPSVPYVAPSGPYANLGAGAASKALVFSSWHVVPKAISVLLSYEVERRMVGQHGDRVSYEQLGRARRPLLTFRSDSDQRPAGMPALALLYPSATLAGHVDPLDLALELGRGDPVPLDVVRANIAARFRPLVERVVAHYAMSDSGPIDQRWHWAVAALLDKEHNPPVLQWAEDRGGLRVLFQEEPDDEPIRNDDDDRGGFAQHVDELLRVTRGEVKLGRPPDDLAETVADLALASPAICAARALLRVSDLCAWDRAILDAAATVAAGFRTLFNVPESISLLRGEDESKPYWRRVLEYCVDGNLQAVLDEYAHLLVETEGCVGKPGPVITRQVAAAMRSALSPRTATFSVDEVRSNGDQVLLESFRVRCRYALRFGDVRDESGATVARAETIRDAFNSPFRPFVLASTSIGQEGLDFHAYCHTVYHWNLPSNPVDLEQREGRVNRYKGHAVRRNVGLRYGLPALAKHWAGEGDPWSRLFQLAANDRPPGTNELVPYWIFETEGGVKVERRIPLLPLSRELHQIDRLKRQLAVYRLAFGQPRQEDLLAHLTALNLRPDEVDAWRIRLEPR